jgi:hypothetical protein
MEPYSRRSFLTKGSAVAAGAAGAVAVGFNVAGAAELDAVELEELTASADLVLVQVKDAARGEVELFVRDQSVVFTDKSLVAKVLRASR